MIDAGTSRVTHTISTTCAIPEVAAMKPDGSQLWVGCYYGDIVVIDTATATVTRFISTRANVGALMFAADGSTVYASHYRLLGSGPTGIDVIDSATGAVTAKIGDENYGEGLVVSPDAATLFVAQRDADSVAVVDTASNTVTSTIPLGGTPNGGILNPDGTAVYYCVNGTSIDVVDLASRSITRDAGAPLRPVTTRLAFAPDPNTLYAVLGRSGGVSVIDVPTGTVTGSVKPSSTGSETRWRRPRSSEPRACRRWTASVPHRAPRPAARSRSPAARSSGGGVTAVELRWRPAAARTPSTPTHRSPPSLRRRPSAQSMSRSPTPTAPAPSERPTSTPIWRRRTGRQRLTPTSGVSSGGTTVVITGTDLSTTKAVYFGGTAASSFTVDSDTQVTAVTRAQTNGTVNVSVTNAAGISTSVPGSQFTFFSPVPVVAAVSPAAGSSLGGDPVTITGTRFTGTFRVTFGGIAVPYTLVSDSQITVVTPPWSATMTPAGPAGSFGSVGPVDVMVTTDVGTSVVSAADQFDYVASA